ncbi:MAG: FtsX-like permease family protein [Pirellulales bacterium]
MSILHRKLLRDLRSSKGLLIAIASIITIGVMLFVYMRTTYYNLLLAKSEYDYEGRLADFWIDLKKAPLSAIEPIREMPGVARLESRIQFFATVDLARSEQPLNGLVISLPDDRQQRLNDVRLTRGSYFSDQRAEEVIVNDLFAAEHGIYPGQTIHLILNNRRQELFVVGTAMSVEFVYLLGPGSLVPDPAHFGVFYIKRSFAEEVFDFDGATNQLVGRFSPEVAGDGGGLLDAIERRLEPYGVFSKTPQRLQASNRFVSDEIEGLGTFARIMPAIFLTVAALVLNVLMSRLVDQQRTIIGTLKALGYRNAQLFLHYTLFGLVVGLIGGLLGLGLGYLMAAWVTDIYGQFYSFPNLANRFYPSVHLQGLAICLATALIGSLRGAKEAIQLSPAEAMRPKPPARGGAIWLEKLSLLWRRLSFGWRMVLRLLFRHKLRTTAGLFAAASGAALLMCGFMMSAAMRYLVDFQYREVLRSDIDLTFSDEQGLDALLEARRLPGVDHAEPQFTLAGTFSHGHHRRDGGIIGLRSDARLTVPRTDRGDAVAIPEAGLVMSRRLANWLDLKVGDRVTFQPTVGERRSLQLPVASITDGYLGIAVYADIEYLSRLVAEEFVMNAVQLQTDGSPANLARLYAEIKQLPAVQAANEREDVIFNLEDTFIKTQNVFIFLLILFAGVIFFGSILNSSLISLAERRREVATLRTLGYTNWQVGGLFLRESMLVNLCGAALGMPIGYALAWLLAWAYTTEMFRFPLVAPAWSWAGTLIAAVAFGLAAHAVVQREINRMQWLEALNVKE